jgi:hypothetical protein
MTGKAAAGRKLPRPLRQRRDSFVETSRKNFKLHSTCVALRHDRQEQPPLNFPPLPGL